MLYLRGNVITQTTIATRIRAMMTGMSRIPAIPFRVRRQHDARQFLSPFSELSCFLPPSSDASTKVDIAFMGPPVVALYTKSEIPPPLTH